MGGALCRVLCRVVFLREQYFAGSRSSPGYRAGCFGGCLEVFQTVWRYEGIDVLFIPACYNNALIYKRNVQIRKDIEQKIVLETEVEFSDEIFAITVRDELLRQLYCYIKELPDGAREIMELSVLGFSGPEIAEKLGITIHTVKTQKNRSFKYLREKLKDSVLLFLI